ncbi:MAG: hypothetical protein JXB25_06170 [Deltaproteobacteria bacterium]|nr:hypothetical protein [Deltaproteobacteria bacterium]
MDRTLHWIRFSWCFLLAVLLLGAGPWVESAWCADATTVYNRYNIHVQKLVTNRGEKIQASYANYTDPGPIHIIIPAGSQLTVKKVSKKLIVFHWPEKNLEVQFEFHEVRMGMDVKTYLDKIASPTPVSFAKLSKIDRKGIAEGKAYVGMSREGVMAALGYPAAHRTPSLEASTYIYWKNRYGTVAVHFNQQGKVIQVVN